MWCQSKGFLLLSLVSALLIILLLQSACKKERSDEIDPDYISRQAFMSKLQGDWYVWALDTYDVQPLILTIRLGNLSNSYDEDSLEYFSNEVPYKKYSINDPILCTLAEINHIQYWTIFKRNDSLFLKTKDLCGVSNSYRIDFSNSHIIYINNSGVMVPTNDIAADIKLVSPDDTIILNNFRSWEDLYGLSYRLIDGDNQWYIGLIHPQELLSIKNNVAE